MKYWYHAAPPIGPLIVETDTTQCIRCIQFSEIQKPNKEKLPPQVQKVFQQLDEYFMGKREAFTIPYTLEGTDLQKKVWRSLADIPAGKTASYSELAQHAGFPKAIRAVASAVGRNPITIILPCHRIIRKDTSLGYYAYRSLGKTHGMQVKAALLKHERTHFSKESVAV